MQCLLDPLRPPRAALLRAHLTGRAERAAELAGCEINYLFTYLQVAAVSGDARRALDICRRATELAQAELTSEGGGQVGMQHVDRAIQEMFCSAKVMAVRSASLHEKMFLRGVLAEFRSNGLEEAMFKQVSTIALTL